MLVMLLVLLLVLRLKLVRVLMLLDVGDALDAAICNDVGNAVGADVGAARNNQRAADGRPPAGQRMVNSQSTDGHRTTTCTATDWQHGNHQTTKGWAKDGWPH